MSRPSPSPSPSAPPAPSAPSAPSAPGGPAPSSVPSPSPTSSQTSSTSSSTSYATILAQPPPPYAPPPAYVPSHDVKEAHPTNPPFSSPVYTSEQLNQEYDALVRLISTTQFRKFATNTLKGAAYATGGIVAGAVVGGPLGMMCGGIIGSIVGYCKSDQFDSLLKIMSKLPRQQQQQLVMDIIALTGKQATLMAVNELLPFHSQILSIIQLYTSAKGSKPALKS